MLNGRKDEAISEYAIEDVMLLLKSFYLVLDSFNISKKGEDSRMMKCVNVRRPRGPRKSPWQLLLAGILCRATSQAASTVGRVRSFPGACDYLINISRASTKDTSKTYAMILSNALRGTPRTSEGLRRSGRR